MTMLHEVARVNQKEPHVRRRWFRDDYFDIFTWQAANGDVVGFQLCYDLTSLKKHNVSHCMATLF